MKPLGVMLLTGWLMLLPGIQGCGQAESSAQPAAAGAAGQTETVPERVIQHQLRVTLHPRPGELEVTDELDLSALATAGGVIEQVQLDLNSALRVTHNQQVLTPVATQAGISRYQFNNLQQHTLSLSYRGKLASTEDCAWLVQACVLLNEKGAFLDGSSAWYPQINGTSQRFSMQVVLPDGWVSLSQGAQTAQGWTEQQPQRDIYLLAGAFHVYEAEQKAGQPRAMVYLQSEDAELAERYLQATARYVDEYSRLLGAYPYAKFATVESFWETGWGMPSFTLLGSQVMRLPFILHSSFPHEILHNWWGNGVYVDSRRGNWSEGLTAYLSDHRNKQASAEGVNYRRDTLQKYAAFATSGGDFPLSEFRSRHDNTTQAIGYGKSLMLFHMLHERLGDEAFFTALRRFYQSHQFEYADFDALRLAFEHSSGEDLQAFFQQWLDGTGAPALGIMNHRLQVNDKGEQQLQLTLQQTQTGKAFTVDVPLQAEFQDGSVQQQTLRMDQAQQSYTLNFAKKLSRVSIDPAFDVFRIPDAREVPPALNVLFNRQPKTFVLSRKVPDGMELVWDDFVDTFSYGQDNMPVQYDDEALPDAGVVVLLGGDNAMLSGLLDRAKQPFKLTETAYTLNSVNYTCGLHSLALTLNAGEQQIILLDAGSGQGLNSLARKLPHYGKYSYVLFNSASGDNVAKGQWEVKDSPLSIHFEEKNNE
jgi:hypothetical protein